MIRKVAALAYEILSFGELALSERNTIISALKFVELLNNSKVRSYNMHTQMVIGERTLEVKIVTDREYMNHMYARLLECSAKFLVPSFQSTVSASDITGWKGGLDTTVMFAFGSDKFHEKHGACFTQERFDVDKFLHESSRNIAAKISLVVMLEDELRETDPDVIQWFADHFAKDETRGEHILAMQQFLYRYTNVTKEKH